MIRPIGTANAQGGIGIGIANPNANGAYGNISSLGGGSGGNNGGLGSSGIGLDGPDMLLGAPQCTLPRNDTGTTISRAGTETSAGFSGGVVEDPCVAAVGEYRVASGECDAGYGWIDQRWDRERDRDVWDGK